MQIDVSQGYSESLQEKIAGLSTTQRAEMMENLAAILLGVCSMNANSVDAKD